MDKLGIANGAVGLCGGKLLTSADLSDTGNEGKHVRNNYDPALEELLSEHDWSFARSRATLALIGQNPKWTEDGMKYVYALPADYVALRALSIFCNYSIESGKDYKVAGKVLLSDASNLKIIYTYKNDDPTTYHPKFSNALKILLASLICFPLTSNQAKTRDLKLSYTNIDLPAAMSADSGESTQTQPRQDEWENARRGGAGLVANPGDQTWHFI